MGTPGLQVADVVELGISHPCSAFSRWDSFLPTRDGRVTGTGHSYARPSRHAGGALGAQFGDILSHNLIDVDGGATVA